MTLNAWLVRHNVGKPIIMNENPDNKLLGFFYVLKKILKYIYELWQTAKHMD